jgi:hypothetical protein
MCVLHIYREARRIDHTGHPVLSFCGKTATAKQTASCAGASCPSAWTEDAPIRHDHRTGPCATAEAHNPKGFLPLALPYPCPT